jgi:AraC-like DNA-binding protein
MMLLRSLSSPSPDDAELNTWFHRRWGRENCIIRIGLATDFMHTNYAGEVDLQTLAGMAHLSKYHFLRLFALVHGVTPHNYLQRKRVTVAARLLASTRQTMGEVARRVGFAEASTLVRQMRRWIGLTPNQIRTRMQVDPAV